MLPRTKRDPLGGGGEKTKRDLAWDLCCWLPQYFTELVKSSESAPTSMGFPASSSNLKILLCYLGFMYGQFSEFKVLEYFNSFLNWLNRRIIFSLCCFEGIDQYDRDSIINDFKNGVCRLLVATSVAARGLDVKQMILVINYSCPNHYEDYVHRVGRTGRAGNKVGIKDGRSCFVELLCVTFD